MNTGAPEDGLLGPRLYNIVMDKLLGCHIGHNLQIL